MADLMKSIALKGEFHPEQFIMVSYIPNTDKAHSDKAHSMMSEGVFPGFSSPHKLSTLPVLHSIK